MRIGVDLDGTICAIRQEGQSYADVLPTPGAVGTLRHWHELGHEIVIMTARHMKTCDGDASKVVARIGKITLDWLERFGIPYDEIHFGKPNTDIYIDDRCIRFTGWAVLIEDILKRNAKDK